MTLHSNVKVRDPDVLEFGREAWANPRLPALLYHSAVDTAGSDPAAAFEALFRSNGWTPEWRNGIYAYHHYHSTAHECLGIAEGAARVVLGGPDGEEVELGAGDVVVLPAGTGHCRIVSSSDFLVVGAYPPSQEWDLCREDITAEIERRILTVPLPPSDPVTGKSGALMRLWR